MTDSTTDVTDQQSVMDYPQPRAAKRPFDPPPRVLARAAEAPVSRVRVWNGSTPWLITGNAELRALTADPRVSADDRLPGYPHWNEGVAAAVANRPRAVANVDGAEHTRLRRTTTRSFTFKQVEKLRPAIQRITDQFIDEMLAGPQPVDLVTALALPVPSMVLCELLGVPYEDSEFFQNQAAKIIEREGTPDVHHGALKSMLDYVRGLVDTNIANPGGDGVIAEIAEHVESGTLSIGEAAIMGTALLIAGHETTANMIALGVLAALQNPDQLAILRDSDDPKEIANGVEEMLRYLSIVQAGERRVATEDIEIAGVVIRAGEGIILDLPAGNWDISVFDDPDRLDLRRPTDRSLAFGFGPHNCIGQQLARAELQIVYSTLFRRVPTLALAASLDEIEFKHDSLGYGVYQLPVSW
ncbi:MAG TPA: cytochrome P450 [Mycobacterium sp.]|nr:cytochrome P450 [Mycobacterium sp.]